MAYSGNLLSRGSTPSTADRLLKAHQQAKYVKELWLFLAGVIGILTVFNILSRVFAVSRRADTAQMTARSPEAYTPGRTSAVSFRRLPAALASAFRVIAFRLTLPIGPSSVATVTEVVFITTYMVALLVWLFVDTRDMDTFLFEDRAAHLASCQLPLIVALAGKNSIISFLVGIGHEKLNVLHRAAARACLLLLWIHAMVRYKAGLPAKFDISNGWMRWGVVGLAAFTLATLLSVRPIRHAAFEFFLVSHIILIGVFLVGGLIHAGDPGFGDYIWPALLVWGLDRFLRAAFVIWNNRVWVRSYDSKATVELLSHDTVRLTLRRSMTWKAGQHAYVILPSVSNLPTEAHPFTIASIPNNMEGSEGTVEKELVFLIRGRTGLTGKLRDHAAQMGSVPIPAYVDGPYGCPPNLKIFDTCVLIAGGSGVSYTLPLLMDLIYNARVGKSSVRRILFLWTIKEAEHLSWFAKLLTKAILASPSALQIDARIHVTGPNAVIPEAKSLDYDGPQTPPSPVTPDDEKKMDLAFSPFVMTLGRPNIDRMLNDVVATSSGPVSVDVAGPSGLAQSVRLALSSEITSSMAVLKGRAPVTLHVETFGMVTG